MENPTIASLIELLKQDETREEGNRYTHGIWEGDMEPFCQTFGIDWWGYSKAFGNRMKKHWVYSWLCTDTRVGIAIYEFDGEYVAISTQNARKLEEVIEFFSEGAYDVVFAFVNSIVTEDIEQNKSIVSVDMDVSDRLARAMRYSPVRESYKLSGLFEETN